VLIVSSILTTVMGTAEHIKALSLH